MPVRLIISLALLSMTIATCSYADEAAPLLLKPPFPAGLTFPRLLPRESFVTQNTVPADGQYHALCLTFDIGPDGNVSNVAVVKPSGDSGTDMYAVESIQHSHYKPATLNGGPIAVRMLTQRILKVGPANSSDRPPLQTCAWDLLKASLKTDAPQTGPAMERNSN